MRVLVADDLSPEGIEILKRAKGLSVDVKVGLKPQELKAIVSEYDALAVRSATKVTAEVVDAAGRLKVVGRAGVGVDNIDLPAASRRGIVVMNTPGGSSVTVAELTLAHMLAVARHVPQATASVRGGKWEKKRFQGHERFGKTLGVVGIGNIGAMVVERALAMKMRVVAYDPFITAEAASKMGAELVSLDELYRRADFISLHVPLTEQTRHLVNAETLGKMKRGVYVVNCARGGIVDEAALAQAIKDGHVGGAAFDVFEDEPPAAENPLLKLDGFICTPHLGASTEEAQVNVAIALAEQLVEFLVHGNIRNAVNVPSVSREVLEKLGPVLGLGHKLGSIAGQLSPANVSAVEITYAGEIVDHPVRAITPQILKGMLTHFMDLPVNEVSAPALAKERGIKVTERRESQSQDFTSLITVRVQGAASELSVAGTIFGRKEPRIVRLNAFALEAAPSGHIIVVHNRDVPGVVGKLGTALGEAGINIGQIALARSGGEAFALVNVDSAVPPQVQGALRAIPGMIDVRQLVL
jgi:D-3-phosphoglycerate dehydrogenase/(S)-sulfolactate dehydrogenase